MKQNETKKVPKKFQKNYYIILLL